MDAIILAGGLGTRLRSVVSEVPKCMAPVAGKPFLWYLLKFLSQYTSQAPQGVSSQILQKQQTIPIADCTQCSSSDSVKINRIILSVGYLRELIYDWIGQYGSEFPFEYIYAVEETPLGTGGGIRLALSKAVSEDVLVVNGDTFFDVDLHHLWAIHNQYQPDITVALRPMKDFERYGTVEIATNMNASIDTSECVDDSSTDNSYNEESHTDSGRILRFKEKQFCREGLINGGIYVVNRHRLSWMDALPEKFSFETVVLEPEAVAGKLEGCIQNGYFIDIGIPSDYKQADLDFKKKFK